MKIIGNINGTQRITSYGDKLYYRSSPSQSYTQVKRAFIKNGSGPFVQFYQYDDTPPVINITSSAADTIDQKYTLEGTIIEEHSGIASVTINGHKATVTGNKFSMNFTLSANTGMSGTNNFVIEAIDNAGNKSSVNFSVNYVNQKNDTSKNWSNVYWKYGSRRNNNHGDSAQDRWLCVIVNGAEYSIRHHAEGLSDYDHDGGGYHDAWCTARVTTSIPLPKGLSYAYFSANASGWGDVDINTGGDMRLTIRDATTGEILATDYQQKNSGTVNIAVAANISKAQATHNLYLDIDGEHSGGTYQRTQAEAGVNESGWTFSFY